MSRINPVHPDQSQPHAVELLDQVEQRLGMVPNLLRTMAHSPAALQAYLAFGDALEGSSLSGKLREQIALVVSEANGCGYCLAAHCAIGKAKGLSDTELTDARNGGSPDSKVKAALHFARQLVDKQGWVSEDDMARVRQAGYTDGEIAEVVAVTAWKIFANYFNHVAGTEVDFPTAPELAA